MSIVFPLVIALLLLGFLPFWVVRWAGSKFGPTDDFRLVGVKGWLAFLITAMGIWGPLYVAGIFVQEFNSIESKFPLIFRSDDYQSYKSSVVLVTAGFLLVQVYAAVRLLVKRDFFAVSFFKKYLLVSPFFVFFYPLLLAIHFSGTNGTQWQDFIGAFFGACIGNGLWYLYLSKSKRVRSTYGIGASIQSTQSQSDRNLPTVKPFQTKVALGSTVENSSVDIQSKSTIERQAAVEGNIRSTATIPRYGLEFVLRRSLGDHSFDSVKWRNYLMQTDSDEVRACALYWRSAVGGDDIRQN